MLSLYTRWQHSLIASSLHPGRFFCGLLNLVNRTVVNQNITYFSELAVRNEYYSGLPVRGHPHQRPPFLYGHSLRGQTQYNVSNIPLTRGHLSNMARFSIPHGWPYKRGDTLYIMFAFVLYTCHCICAPFILSSSLSILSTCSWLTKLYWCKH